MNLSPVASRPSISSPAPFYLTYNPFSSQLSRTESTCTHSHKFHFFRCKPKLIGYKLYCLIADFIFVPLCNTFSLYNGDGVNKKHHVVDKITSIESINLTCVLVSFRRKKSCLFAYIYKTTF